MVAIGRKDEKGEPKGSLFFCPKINTYIIMHASKQVDTKIYARGYYARM